ncbi:tyrosine-type recombinase/integrase [Microlunatus sp. Gsoil 973]|uniref:tyrosine-type recombinase/integrase n=1 Tax=Microlunatus sp. Gsoil 973 TaxID=2672569 RepID=UPI001E594C77|nr:tyrosine-type recombinase/integrase [Microlunatus sp. Gsoil 973]
MTVSKNTHRIDEDLVRVLPKSLAARELGTVSDREIARCFESWLAVGLSEKSATRYRASLSVFFGWCVRERLILANPVIGVRVPKQSVEPVEMLPFTEDELEAAYLRWKGENARLADILLVLGWTGLRWSEVRAVTVRDLMQVPTPGLVIRRAAPEGVGTKSTKGRRSRRVPLADRVLPIVLDLAEGRKPNDLLFTTDRGAQLHRTPVLRSVNWSTTSDGRRIHDLRHTAACLWLARGVDPGTVQAWMGHESIATTNLYLHFLGTSADSAGLEKLNFRHGVRPGCAEEV